MQAGWTRRCHAVHGTAPAWAIALLAVAVLGGCAASPLPRIRAAYASGDYVGARDGLLKLESSDPDNAHLWWMERSLPELALHRPETAEQILRKARDRLDDLSSSNALEWFSAVLLDDRQLTYTGADYEHVLVRAMLAVSNLMYDGRDANAYAIQVLQRQQQIMASFEQNGQRPKANYKLVAFGAYLQAILAEESPQGGPRAARAYRRVMEIEPGFRDGPAAIERATHGVHSAKGNGVVHVLALVGRGPERVEVDEPATANALAIAQIIWAHNRGRTTFPNISSVKIPALGFHGDNPTEVHVEVDGAWAGTTAVVTDVEKTAEAEFAAMHDYIVARAVLRRAFKIAVTEGLKEVVNPKRAVRDRRGRVVRKEADPWVDLAISLGGLLWTSAERADLRCWSLLPASFQVLRLELPAGDHEITLRAATHGAASGDPQTIRVHVRDGYNTYVLGLTPTVRGGPPPLTSDPEETPRNPS